MAAACRSMPLIGDCSGAGHVECVPWTCQAAVARPLLLSRVTNTQGKHNPLFCEQRQHLHPCVPRTVRKRVQCILPSMLPVYVTSVPHLCSTHTAAASLPFPKGKPWQRSIDASISERGNQLTQANAQEVLHNIQQAWPNLDRRPGEGATDGWVLDFPSATQTCRGTCQFGTLQAVMSRLPMLLEVDHHSMWP